MKHIFRCKNCATEIEYNMLSFSSLVQCPHCKKEYIVSKNVIALILELIFMFMMAMGMRGILGFTNTTFHIILEFVIVLVMILVLNILFDYIFVKVICWHEYFHLLERVEKKKKTQK